MTFSTEKRVFDRDNNQDVLVSRPSYELSNCLEITPVDNIEDAYNWLKSSSRNSTMGTLSSLNRRVLVLLPGIYRSEGAFTLDANYVDIYAPYGGVIVTTKANADFAVIQTAQDIKLTGFTIKGKNAGAFNILNYNNVDGDVTGSGPYTLTATGVGVGVVAGDKVYIEGTGPTDGWYDIASVVDNDNITVDDCGATGEDILFITIPLQSIYANMKFVHGGTPTSTTPTCGSITEEYTSYGGTWINCEGDVNSWNMYYINALHSSFALYDFSTYINCRGDDKSWGGSSGYEAGGGIYLAGKYYDCIGQDYCFGGGAQGGCRISSSAIFRNCTAGNGSFGVEASVAGTFYNCHAGSNSFAGNSGLGSYLGIFSGIAYGCSATENSFGAGDEATEYMSGIMKGCRVTGLQNTLRLTGGSIDDCYFTATADDTDCLTLLDSNSKIYNSTLIATGTGKSINAGSALNVVSAHNRMNLGLGANVTNLVTTPYDVVDSNIE